MSLTVQENIEPSKVIIPKSDREEHFKSISQQGYHKVAYRDWGEENSDESVFCLHGLTRNSHDFDQLAKTMSTQRRVICPDLIGRGNSEWLASSDDYQLSQYNLDFTVLTNKIGCEEYDIIGTSLGGLMGIAMAGMKNSPVRRLVINDIAPEVPFDALKRLTNYIGQNKLFVDLAEVETSLRESLAPFGPMTDEDWARMAIYSSYECNGGYKLSYDPSISKNYIKYWNLVYFNLWKYWNNIKCPVLILRGMESDFLTKPLLKRMKRRLPHADVIEFEGVGHTPTLNAAIQIDPILEWFENN